jgi:hypothetical protein
VLTNLRNTLQRVLTDVREAVEDWPKMRRRALDLADELETATLPVPEKDITDSVALLRWLADDHFTFLGYREYRLRADCGPPRPAATVTTAEIAPVEAGPPEQLLQAVLGTGLGHPAPGPGPGAPAVVHEPGGVPAGDGEAPAHHHEGELTLHSAPFGVPGLHRREDVRRRRQRRGRAPVPGAVHVGGVPDVGQGACRSSSARWPRSSPGPG